MNSTIVIFANMRKIVEPELRRLAEGNIKLKSWAALQSKSIQDFRKTSRRKVNAT